jgi:amino acid adenylation domain-containing protein
MTHMAPIAADIPERARLLAWGEGPHRALAWTHVIEAIEAQAARTPDRRAAVCGDTALDYATLDARCNRLAHHLQARGVRPGDRVALCLPRGLDLVVALLAVLKAGGVYLPLDTRHPAARIAFILEDARVALTVTAMPFRHLMPAGRPVCLVDAEAPAIAACDAAPLSVARDPDAPIYVIYTSGSTGEPKGAAAYHRGFANLVQWYLETMAVTAADRVLIIGAFTFDASQKNLFAPLVAGGELHLPVGDAFDPEALAAAIAAGGITWVNGTPSNFYPIVEGPGARRPALLRSLRWVVLGGEPITPQRLLPWLRDPACGARILNTYGPTECTDICAAWAFGAGDAEPQIPLGRPIDNVRITVLDEHGALAGPDEAGELWIGGAGVGAGYLNRDALNARHFVELPVFGQRERLYRTGDRVRWRADGVLEFLGRIDHQVKLRGFRVELGEIEAALKTLPAIREAVVLLREDTPGDQRLVAYVAAGPDGVPGGEAALRRHLAERMPDYMVPAAFVWRDSFALTPNGKIDRRMLPPPEAAPAPEAGAASGVAAHPVAGASATEQALMGIWQTVLKRDAIGLDDNFFDVGGTSLSMVEVQAALGRRLGRLIPVVALFAHPTIRRLARALDGDAGAAEPARGRAARQVEALRRLAGTGRRATS